MEQITLVLVMNLLIYSKFKIIQTAKELTLQILKNLEENVKLKSSIKIENLVITPIVLNDFNHEHKIVSLDDFLTVNLLKQRNK